MTMNHSRIAIAAVAATLLVVPSLANTDTDLKINGSVKCYVKHDFKEERPVNSSIIDRIDKNKPTNTNQINIEKFRLNLSSKTPSTKYGDITTNVELEGNSFDKEKGIKLHKAEINVSNWTLGLAESTFVDADASPEVLSPAALMGQPNFAVSIFNLVRYSAPINQNVSFAASIETPNSEGSISSFKCPTLVGALTYSDSWGHIGFRVLEQHWSAPDVINKWNGGAQLSGAVKVGKDKLVGTISSGKGLGVYGLGSENYYFKGDEQVDPYVHTCSYAAHSTSWLLGYTHHWNDKVRSNVAYSHTKLINTRILRSAQDGTVNIIANVAKGVEFGMEYLLGSKKDSRHYEGPKSSNHLRSLSATMTVKF